MTKMQKAEKIANEFKGGTLLDLAKKIENEVGVGVYIDQMSEFDMAKRPHMTHRIQIWILRNGSFSRHADQFGGWISVSRQQVTL